MSSLPNQLFGNLSQETSGSPGGLHTPRTPANTTSLRALGTLRGARAPSGSSRVRNDQSLYPGARTVTTSSANCADGDRRLSEDGSAVLDVVDQRPSRPLVSHETEHRDYAMNNSEAQGNYCHIVLSVGQAKILFDMSNLSDNILKMSDQVGGVLQKVEAALVKINQVSVMVDGMGNTVEGISNRVGELTTLVQSGPTIQPTPNNTGTVEPTNVGPWLCSTELRSPIPHWRLPTKSGSLTPFSIVSSAIHQKPALSQFLPPQVNGVSEVAATRAYNSEIKNVCKHIRERVHLILLTDVYDPKKPLILGAVPNLKAIVHWYVYCRLQLNWAKRATILTSSQFGRIPASLRVADLLTSEERRFGFVK
ncbi:uncharacterized protein MELLADRAFT_88554 [Melampsora larici-populina 98AG31]|uniref:Uncharacterized protein n=1 Tax=Melampsora larici-populina (strain 98AG31 / pathotype 3-4-7) TaxID=747676 RepID=F4RS63_MELLP|nr:uncharacterized protein MELLADRAFT_88554 [Melampsora larici-populina 98AG31]EGG04800.1 hypothetical protein MELLADRAFT_88554 [Melampsora larici-populina 98AG31]